jgi:hypothetical protein
MRTKGMAFTELLEMIFDERGNPVSISLIDLPGESDKGHEILFIVYLPNIEFLVCHAVSVKSVLVGFQPFGRHEELYPIGPQGQRWFPNWFNNL